MTGNTRIWLIRHGQPEPAAQGRCYGKSDYGLSVEGIGEIQAATTLLDGEVLSAIYASPRARTMESARILADARSMTVEAIDALAEIDFGDFEGRTYDEIAERHADLDRTWMEHPTKIQFPNGESFDDMWERVTKAIEALLARHAGQTIAVVTHGGVNRIALAWAMGLPRENVFRLGQRYAAVNAIQWFGDYPSVELLNA
jgi:alpha-ribazole phosphatase